MGRRLALWSQLLRTNRRFFATIFRYDLALIAVGVLYILAGPGPEVGMTESRGLFAALVLFMLATMQAQVLRRTAAGLRSFVGLPVRREVLLAIFYVGFALPAALALALAGIPATLLAGGATAASATAARTANAVLGLLFIKSLVVNILIVIRYRTLLMVAYLLGLTGMLLALLIFRSFVAGMIPVSNGILAAAFVAASFAGVFAVVRDIEF